MRCKRLVALAGLVLAVSMQPAFALNVRDHRDPNRGPGVSEIEGPAVFEVPITKSLFRTLRCETRNLQGAADPVLHVLRFPANGGPVQEIARGDDTPGSLNARVSVGLWTSGRLLIVMRASGKGRTGAADLWCGSNAVGVNLPVGGGFQRLIDLSTNETLQTAPLAGSSPVHTLYVFDDNQKMLARYPGGADQSAFVDGGHSGVRIVMAGSSFLETPARVRLVRNDIKASGSDPDGDGLGNRLEAAIGTCSRRQTTAMGFDCDRAYDLRDTDGDGLRDGLELVGKLDEAPYQFLAAWGADVRHKDVFIELDYGRNTLQEAVNMWGPNPPPSGGESLVKRFARAYAGTLPEPVDGETGLVSWDAFFDSADFLTPVQQQEWRVKERERRRIAREAEAYTLRNPDGLPGINVHLDTGVETGPADSPTLYGDWGGSNIVEPNCSGSTCTPVGPDNAYLPQMAASRRKVFHYALGDYEVGGQAGYGIALNFPTLSAGGAAHEFGHTLDLMHDGVPQRGVNCMPNYPSEMNYAYGGTLTFSGSTGRDPINPVSLQERGAVQAQTADGYLYLKDLRQRYEYSVDKRSGDIDWNRDGMISDSPVRGYASFKPGSSCESTRNSKFNADGWSKRAPALGRVGDRTVILYIHETDNKLKIVTGPANLPCTKLNQSCGDFSGQQNAPGDWNRDIEAVDAHPMLGADGKRFLLIVFRKGEALFETTLSDALRWSAPRRVRTTSAATGDVSLTGSDRAAILAFRNPAGRVAIVRRGNTTGWGAEQLAAGAPLVTIAPVPEDASPAVLLAPLNDGTEALFGAFPTGPMGKIGLYVYDDQISRWRPSIWKFQISQSGDDLVIGKPAMAFEATDGKAPLPVRLHILYPQRELQPKDDGLPRRIIQGAVLVVPGLAQPDGSFPTPVLKTSVHDNTHYFGFGVDLLREPGVDDNLRALVSTAVLSEGAPLPHWVEFRPHADGIFDTVLADSNDWEVLGRKLCITLKDAGASVSCGPR